MYDKVKFKLYVSSDIPAESIFNNVIFLNNVSQFPYFGCKKLELINIHKYANEATC